MTSENISTDLLITQLKQGNEQAFTSLYDMFASHIYRNILRLVKDEEIAQEILQDLFLKVWEIREKIKVEGSFKSFLHKVAANMVYMHFRQVSKNERLIEKLIASSVEANNFKSCRKKFEICTGRASIPSEPPLKRFKGGFLLEISFIIRQFVGMVGR